MSDRRSGIAQLAEQRAVNATVAGSSPAPGATQTGSPMWDPVVRFGAVAQWSEQGTHNPWVVGSIPTRPTKVRVLVRLRPDIWASVDARQCVG